MGSRFVRPDTKTLTISNGDTLIVKRRLNTGEWRARIKHMKQAGVDPGAERVSALQVGPSTIIAYLLDWSLRDDDGTPVVIRGTSPADLETILDSLDLDTFREIREAIDAHEEQMDAEELEDLKNAHGTPRISAVS